MTPTALQLKGRERYSRLKSMKVLGGPVSVSVCVSVSVSVLVFVSVLVSVFVIVSYGGLGAWQ